jgi:hypothetical protein
MKNLFIVLIIFSSVSAFANSLELIASENDSNGHFKATYRVALMSKLEISMDAAIGAGVRDTYIACKEFPCAECAIQEFKTLDSNQGRCTGGTCSFAKVEVTLRGLNCGTH